jgi:hypothetical protein
MEDGHMDSMDRIRERVEALEQQTKAMAAHTRTVEQRLRWWRGIAYDMVMLVGAIGIALGSMTPAHADVINCGDVLGPGGRFELEHNLECDLHAVTVQDGAILELNGHIVTCHDGLRCIILMGTGAQLLNGAVKGEEHESIVLEGAGGHTVRNVTSALVDNNIVVQSDHNQLINVTAESTISPAFNITGNNNRLTDNIALCFQLFFAGGCIRIGGNGNRLINNFATATTSGAPGIGGFSIAGNNNVLRGNRAIRNQSSGITVTGTGNSLQRNTALENLLDLQDTNGDCAHNTWGPNTFDTSDPVCIRQSTAK